MPKDLETPAEYRDIEKLPFEHPHVRRKDGGEYDRLPCALVLGKIDGWSCRNIFSPDNFITYSAKQPQVYPVQPAPEAAKEIGCPDDKGPDNNDQCR